MAMSALTGNAVLRAHDLRINGCAAPHPDLDDAHEILSQAHAVLAVINSTPSDTGVNPKILGAAYRGVETLLEQGIRSMVIGHVDLIAELH